MITPLVPVPVSELPPKPITIPTVIRRFEQFIMDNRFNHVQGRVMSSSAGKQLLLLGSTALAPIAEYLLQEDESSSEQNYKENGELREAWVHLLYRIALKDNLGYRPSYAFDSVGFTAWALWARALG